MLLALSHTVPHCPLWNTSIRPSLGSEPPTSLKSVDFSEKYLQSSGLFGGRILNWKWLIPDWCTFNLFAMNGVSGRLSNGKRWKVYWRLFTQNKHFRSSSLTQNMIIKVCRYLSLFDGDLKKVACFSFNEFGIGTTKFHVKWNLLCWSSHLEWKVDELFCETL